MTQPPEPTPTTTPATGAEGDPSPEDDETFDGPDFDADKARAALSKKNREAQNLRKRLKDAEPMLEEFNRWKETQKTEAQRQAELAEAQMFELSSAKEQLARQTACLKAGFTADEIVEFASRLRGEDEEALVEDAKKLKARLAPAAGRRADTSQGRGNSPAASPAALFAQILKRD